MSQRPGMQPVRNGRYATLVVDGNAVIAQERPPSSTIAARFGRVPASSSDSATSRRRPSTSNKKQRVMYPRMYIAIARRSAGCAVDAAGPLGLGLGVGPHG
jgi:hypothetical protein